ncbi:hypothetical protein WD019_02950 [Fictibacillus sp. Mic-4]|uniref:hypothetical protein n=1 Tax=Fictibacillus sp. Mic-4 TaxID=3132826 RepID=UPI003CF78690
MGSISLDYWKEALEKAHVEVEQLKTIQDSEEFFNYPSVVRLAIVTYQKELERDSIPNLQAIIEKRTKEEEEHIEYRPSVKGRPALSENEATRIS